jgi:hypothetical protein
MNAIDLFFGENIHIYSWLLCKFVCVHTHKSQHTFHPHTHTHTHTHTHKHACMNAYMHAYTHTQMCTHLHILTAQPPPPCAHIPTHYEENVWHTPVSRHSSDFRVPEMYPGVLIIFFFLWVTLTTQFSRLHRGSWKRKDERTQRDQERSGW